MIWLEHGSAVMSKYTDKGYLGIQIDAYGEQNSGVEPFPAVHQLGFASRPRDADEEGDCSLLMIFQGDQAFVLPFPDSRAVAKHLPELTQGSSVQYAHRSKLDGPSWYLINAEDGTHTALCEYENGKQHVFTFGKDSNGAPMVSVVHGDGTTIELKGGVATLKNASGSISLEVGASRINTVGDVKTQTGVSLETHTHLTAMGPTGTPTPVPG